MTQRPPKPILEPNEESNHAKTNERLESKIPCKV